MMIERDTLLPLSYQVTEIIEKKIIAERLKRGDQLPRLTEMASELGISMETVRSAYHELARQGIISIQHGRGTFVEKGYVKLIHEQAKRTGIGQNTVGVIMTCKGVDFSLTPVNLVNVEYQDSKWWAENIFNAIKLKAAEEGNLLTLATLPNEWDFERCETLIFDLLRQVGGFIIFPFHRPVEEQERIMRLVTCSGIPYVTINPWRIDQKYNFVATDSYRGAAEVAQYFFKSNLRSYVWLGEADSASVSGLLLWKGFRETLLKLGVSENDIYDWELKCIDVVEAFELVRERIEGIPRPVGILAHGDYVGIEAMRASKEKGLKVPEDVSVVGCTGISGAEHSDPPLSTLSAPMFDIGVKALEMLKMGMKGERRELPGIFLKGRLILRGSTR